MSKHKCPGCDKVFDELLVVHSTSGEPFTAVELMEGLDAYGAISVPKAVICHVDNYLHFTYGMGAEERLVHIKPYDPDEIQRMKDYYQQHVQVCEHEGCGEDGIPCYFRPLDVEPNGWYCKDHCYDAGFCRGCGLFNAGWESFDLNRNGLCDGCSDYFEAEMTSDDDYDDDFYGD